MVDVLLFDLGGVLIDFAGFEELSRLNPDVDRTEIRRRWINCEAVRLFERGDIAPDEFAHRFLAEWDLGMFPDEFMSEFASWARGLYPGAATLLRGLRATHRLACLSNSNELHTPLHRETVRPYIERCFFSNELGLLKPQPEIFDHVVRELHVPPHRIVFFDDTQINVDAAARAGMNGYLTDGLADLERALRSLGL